ncbi:MAG: glycosyltransferase family 39 protein, partial [Shimia sp.]
REATLALTAFALYRAARVWLPPPQALCAMLGAFWTPHLLWEFQRASSHTLALVAMGAVTLWLWARMRTRPARRRDIVVFGTALGLGFLSKYNFAVIPLALLVAGGLAPRVWIGALAIASVMVAWPLVEIARVPEVALASAGKLDFEAGHWAAARLRAGGVLLREGAAVLLLPLIGALILHGRPLAPSVWRGPALASAGITAALVVGGGLVDTSARWLFPATLPMLLALYAAPSPTPWRRRLFLAFSAALLSAALVASYATRTADDTRQRADFAALADRLAPWGTAERVVIGDHTLAGNLAYARPALRVLADQSFHADPGGAALALTPATQDAEALRTPFAGPWREVGRLAHTLSDGETLTLTIWVRDP